MFTQPSYQRLFMMPVLCALVLSGYSTSQAQSIWIKAPDGPYFRLEVHKAGYDSAPNIQMPTSVWFVAWATMVMPGVAIVGEVPFSYYQESRPDHSSYSQQQLGNPYLGVRFSSPSNPATGEFGIRIPSGTSEADAAANGILTDVSRLEAFTSNSVGLRARTGSNFVFDEGAVTLSIHGGGNLLIPTKRGVDPELLFDADVSLWYQQKGFTVGGIVAIKTLMSVPLLTLTERSEFQLGLTAAYRLGRAEPALHVRFPLGNHGLFQLGEWVNQIVGISITVDVGKSAALDPDPAIPWDSE